MGLFTPARAQWQSKGELGIESRIFQGDERAATEDYGLGVAGRFELTHAHGLWRQSVRLFGRFDQRDAGRNALVIEEAWLGWEKSRWRLRAGYQMLTWSATEVFHPADVINSRNLDGPVENLEKLGEPTMSLWYRLGSGSVSAYYMPSYVRPLLPSAASRLSVAPGTRLGETLWLGRDGSSSEQGYGHQWATRVTQTIGRADVALQVVRHQDRHQPTFVFDPALAAVRPLYRPVTLVAGTYSQVFGAVVAKVEVAQRSFAEATGEQTFSGQMSDQDHTQVAAGLEYGWTHDGGSESTFILEGQSLWGLSKAERSLGHIFQRDVLLGFRRAANDEDGKELLVTAIVDLERHREALLAVSYKQRIGDAWSVKGGVRFIEAPPTESPPAGLQPFHRSNHVYLNLVRYF